MATTTNKILLFIVCLLFGFLLSKQFFLQKEVSKISQPEIGNSIALEVTELIKTNSKSRKQIDIFTEQKTKLEKSAESSQESNETLQENLQIYKIILGLTDVQGPGIEITFNEKIDSTQVIDLINAVKNIGSEAITINNRRYGPRSFIESGIFYPPTNIQVIGNADILEDSLIRPGGIIEQIGTGKVEKKEIIYLKSIQ